MNEPQEYLRIQLNSDDYYKELNDKSSIQIENKTEDK